MKSEFDTSALKKSVAFSLWLFMLSWVVWVCIPSGIAWQIDLFKWLTCGAGAALALGSLVVCFGYVWEWTRSGKR